jgi:RNA polymerase sigma factor (sigma-70 family)
MSAGEASLAPSDALVESDMASLIQIVGRIVRARVANAAVAEDLIQETLLKVLSAADRVEDGMLEPYAIATARNLMASMWRAQARERRNQHRVLEVASDAALDEGLLRGEEQAAISAALERISERDRRTLLAHEVDGLDTRSLADELGLSAGAVAAQLNRTRARMRVEYLLALQELEPPTPQCRPVLFALSSADRRRQREVDAARHLLECEVCAALSRPLLQRGKADDDDIRIRIHGDPDIVEARKQARQLAAQLNFSRTDATLTATAVSEIARNIVRFAGDGLIVMTLVEEPRPGLRIVARDTGPGIPDVEQALADGYSTYNGLGLGLPGARRLMDEFSLISEVGLGTTVTMTKWRSKG